MSIIGDDKFLAITGGIAGVALIGSALMLYRIQTLESQIQSQNSDFDRMMAEMENRTKSLETPSSSDEKIKSI
jgi:hypothetical protein